MTIPNCVLLVAQGGRLFETGCLLETGCLSLFSETEKCETKLSFDVLLERITKLETDLLTLDSS